MGQPREPVLGSNGSFNASPNVRESHNCYSYFLNLKSQEAVEMCKKEFKKRVKLSLLKSDLSGLR